LPERESTATGVRTNAGPEPHSPGWPQLIDAWLKQSRKAQGLPETIEDETIVTRVLVLAGITRAIPRESCLDGTRATRPPAEAPRLSSGRLSQ
jgi:hypothetical protein